MATFVLIHGAGDSGWHWHLVEPELRARGHGVVRVDLPCEGGSAGREEYADAAVEAIGDSNNPVVVAQSFGGFTAPLVCERVSVELMVLITPMIPAAGESPNDYWANTGWKSPRLKVESRDGMSEEQAWTVAAFLHDVPPDLAVEALKGERGQSETPGLKPWPLNAWPDVPTRFLLCRDDRFFPPDWMRQVVQERVGVTPDEIDGSHCVALSRPRQLAARLHKYAAEV